jgi:replicative DNA helicase
MSDACPYDEAFQRAVLRLMQTDEPFAARAFQWIDRGFFTTEALGWIFTVFEGYWRDYHAPCADSPLRVAVGHAPSHRSDYYHQEVEAVIARANVPEADWVKDKLTDFCRRSVFAIAHRESASLYTDGKPTEAYDVMAKAQDRIREIDFDYVDRQWFFEELGDRQNARMREDRVSRMSTGILELDAACGGGAQPGEVWSVFAYAKRCKTTWLCNQGYFALRTAAAPVLHVVLEGRGDKIAARYDSMFSNELYTKVKRGDIEPRMLGFMHEEYSRMRRRLVIRTMNDWDVNMTHVQAEVKELASNGFVPRMLILDYVDLLRSRYENTGEGSERQHQVEASRDLKRFVNQHDLACWTAWQATRPKPDAHTREHVLTSGNVADAYAKVRIVDAYGSLNATDEEMEQNQMRIFWEAHRDSPVRRTWAITNDLDRSRMAKEVIGLETPAGT